MNNDTSKTLTVRELVREMKFKAVQKASGWCIECHTTTFGTVPVFSFLRSPDRALEQCNRDKAKIARRALELSA